MPELPEVETTLRGIEPFIRGRNVTATTLREARLRWPVTPKLPQLLKGRQLKALHRRAKYLLFDFNEDSPSEWGGGTLVMHLGMSGSLRLVEPGTPPRKHDHLDITFADEWLLRFHDPRRFGAALWVEGDPSSHQLLRNLGPEPLTEEFNGDYLYRNSRLRKLPVKQFLMNNQVVVGVGNIYASEALFRAGVSPLRQAGSISLKRYQLLAEGVQEVLSEAIAQGGTTLRDFVNGQGNPGYFKQRLQVYGRGALPCRTCKRQLKEIRLGQRSTVYCGVCQR